MPKMTGSAKKKRIELSKLVSLSKRSLIRSNMILTSKQCALDFTGPNAGVNGNSSLIKDTACRNCKTSLMKAFDCQNVRIRCHKYNGIRLDVNKRRISVVFLMSLPLHWP